MSAASYVVRFTEGARRDLDGIFAFVASYASEDHAYDIVDLLIERALALAEYPLRGSVPGEAIILGMGQYRQLVHRQYRLVYEVTAKEVAIVLIADGRRDMRTLLLQRLIR